MRSSIAKLFSLVILAATFSLFTLTGIGSPSPNSAQEIYNRKCALCHGKDGSGNTHDGKKYKVPSVRVAVKKYSEAAMIKIVEEGKGANMDSYSDELSPTQIKALVDYYRSLAKK
jgi:mono/diheme cytochrome c family protein